MKNKKMFISVIVIATAMLFVCGCGKPAKSVSAEPAETVKEFDATEHLKRTHASAVGLEESRKRSDVGDNSENEIDATEEEEAVVKDEESDKTGDTVQTGTASSNDDRNTSTGTAPAQSGQSTPAQSASATTPKPTQPASAETAPEQSASTTTPAPVQPTPAQPAHTHNWIAHTVTGEVWVSDIVIVYDYENRVVGHVDDLFICDCGYNTTNRDDLVSHISQTMHGFFMQPGYDIIESTIIGSHEEDHGHYETQTHVDYYYCECGERKN